jgi:hypothetical protein
MGAVPVIRHSSRSKGWLFPVKGWVVPPMKVEMSPQGVNPAVKFLSKRFRPSLRNIYSNCPDTRLKPLCLGSPSKLYYYPICYSTPSKTVVLIPKKFELAEDYAQVLARTLSNESCLWTATMSERRR